MMIIRLGHIGTISIFGLTVLLDKHSVVIISTKKVWNKTEILQHDVEEEVLISFLRS